MTTPAAVQDAGLQVAEAAMIKPKAEVAPSKTVDIGMAGEGSQVAYNPLEQSIGQKDYERAAVKAAKTASIPGAGGATGQVKDLISYAKQFVGVKYTWGGNTPLSGFDCSGFVRWVYKKFGVDLPRVSAQQAAGGTAVSRENMKPGDLVFWGGDKVHHVALYLGNGQIIAAPKPGDHVKIQPIYGDYFAKRYL